MFLGVCTSAHGFDKSSYGRPLTMALPKMDKDTRLLDIEDAIVTDRMLKWGFHNPKLLNELIGGHGAVHVAAKCAIPNARSRYIAPSVAEVITLNHPITIGDISYFVKRTIEGGIEMYNDGAFGYFEVDVTIKTTATNSKYK